MPAFERENVVRATLIALLFPVLYLLVMFVVDNGYSLVWAWRHPGSTTADLTAQLNSAALVLLLVTVAVFFVVVVITFAIRRRSLPKRVMWRAVVPKPVYGFVVLLVAGLIFTGFLVASFIPASWVEGDTVTGVMAQPNPVLIILVVGIVAPVGEEVAFRGLMMTRLIDRVAPWLAVGLPFVAFCAFHLLDSLGHIVTVIPLAISVCLAFYWTRSFKVPLLIHVLYNAVLAVVTALSTNVADTTTEASSGVDVTSLLVGLLGVAAVVVALVSIYRDTHVKVKDFPPPHAEDLIPEVAS